MSRKPRKTGHFFIVSVRSKHATASRNEEPFDLAIANRGMLPNPVTRYCTVTLSK
jgi:hypothetical protein